MKEVEWFLEKVWGKKVCACALMLQCEKGRQIDHMDGGADGGQVVLRTSQFYHIVLFGSWPNVDHTGKWQTNGNKQTATALTFKGFKDTATCLFDTAQSTKGSGMAASKWATIMQFNNIGERIQTDLKKKKKNVC